MCTVQLPPGSNPLAVNKYIIPYHIISYRIISRTAEPLGPAINHDTVRRNNMNTGLNIVNYYFGSLWLPCNWSLQWNFRVTNAVYFPSWTRLTTELSGSTLYMVSSDRLLEQLESHSIYKHLFSTSASITWHNKDFWPELINSPLLLHGFLPLQNY
jgi:hypothetical protein